MLKQKKITTSILETDFEILKAIAKAKGQSIARTVREIISRALSGDGT